MQEQEAKDGLRKEGTGITCIMERNSTIIYRLAFALDRICILENLSACSEGGRKEDHEGIDFSVKYADVAAEENQITGRSIQHSYQPAEDAPLCNGNSKRTETMDIADSASRPYCT